MFALTRPNHPARVIALLAAFCLLAIGVAALAQQTDDGRIVGGQEADPGEWPWQVAIVQRGADTYNGQFCGGSLISRDWVLTAAHCVGSLTPNDIDVAAGLHNLVTPDPGFLRVGVAEIIIHPGWYGGGDSDIALLRLAEPIDERPAAADALPIAFVRTAPGDAPTFVGETSVVTGWGNTLGQPDPGGIDYPAGLHEVEVPVVSNEYCNAAYFGSITDNMLCAGLLRGGADSCQGDSGGPLVIFDDAAGDWLLAGIVSFGQGCGVPGIPGVYTRVSPFADWLRELTVPFVPTDWAYIPGTFDVLPVQELTNGDFEQGQGVGWIESSSGGWPVVLHASTLPALFQPHGGEWAAWLGGADLEYTILSQEVTIPVDAPVLTFFYQIDSIDYCGYDFGGVFVSGTSVDYYDLCAATLTSGWTLRTLDLSSYAGETVVLDFVVSTDGSYYSSLYVDDVVFKSTDETEAAVSAAPQPKQDAPLGASGSARPGSID